VLRPQGEKLLLQLGLRGSLPPRGRPLWWRSGLEMLEDEAPHQLWQVVQCTGAAAVVHCTYWYTVSTLHQVVPESSMVPARPLEAGGGGAPAAQRDGDGGRGGGEAWVRAGEAVEVESGVGERPGRGRRPTAGGWQAAPCQAPVRPCWCWGRRGRSWRGRRCAAGRGGGFSRVLTASEVPAGRPAGRPLGSAVVR
jgi:hypothetical protein